MMTKQKTESETFDKIMDGLLAVPYSELQEKIEEEKRMKAAKKKKPPTSSPSSPASSDSKKQDA